MGVDPMVSRLEIGTLTQKSLGTGGLVIGFSVLSPHLA